MSKIFNFLQSWNGKSLCKQGASYFLYCKRHPSTKRIGSTNGEKLFQIISQDLTDQKLDFNLFY